MNERDELFAAILADPQDDAVRLVFADWLEEHGEAERAEFIRLQIHHSPLPDSVEREPELLSTYGPVWRQAECSVTNDGAYERGFIEWLEISGYDWWRQLEAKSAFFTESPGRSVRIQNANLSWNQPGEPDPRTVPIHRLILNSCDAADDVLVWLVTLSLPNLVELRLGNNFIDDEGLRRLAASTNMPRLRVLDLSGNVFSNEGLAALLHSDCAAKLDTLILENNENLTAAVVPIIARAPTVPHLSQLKLAGTSIPPRDQQRLMELATGHAARPMSPPPAPVLSRDDSIPIRDDEPIPERRRFDLLLLRWAILGTVVGVMLAFGSVSTRSGEFTHVVFQIPNVAAMTTLAGIGVLVCHRFLIPFARRIGAPIYPLLIAMSALIAWLIDPTVMLSMVLAVLMGSLFGVRTVVNNVRLMEVDTGNFRYHSRSTSFGIPLTSTILAGAWIYLLLICRHSRSEAWSGALLVCWGYMFGVIALRLAWFLVLVPTDGLALLRRVWWMFVLSSAGMSSAVIMAALVELDPLSTRPAHLTYLLLLFLAALGGMSAAMFLWTDPAPHATRIETYLAEMFRRARAFSSEIGRLMFLGMAVTLVVVYWFAPWREFVSSHASNLTRVAVSADGTMAASGSLAGEVHVWELATGTDIPLGKHNGHVSALSFGPSGELWSAGRDGVVRVTRIQERRWIDLQSPDDLQAKRVYWLQAEDNGRCRAIQGGQWVRYDSGSESGTIVESRLPKLPTFVIAEGILRWGEFPVVSIIPSPDGRWVLVATGFRIGLWDAERQRWEWQRLRDDTVYLAEFSQSGRGVLVTSTTGLHWLERTTGEEHDGRKLRCATNVEWIPGTNEWLLGDRARLIRVPAIHGW